MGNIFLFFNFHEKTPFDVHSLKISSNVLQVDFPQISNIRMDFISCVLNIPKFIEYNVTWEFDS